MALGDWLQNTLGASSNLQYQELYSPYASHSHSTTTTAIYPMMFLNSSLGTWGITSQFSQDGDTTLKIIKDSVYEIKNEAVSEDTKHKVITKADRLRKLGILTQAEILDNELKARVRLARIKEWSYKVLPYEAIKQYDMSVTNGYYNKVHIDKLDKYAGIAPAEHGKVALDKIIPDFVLDHLETAQERQVFDDYAVLWVEKVKDPLLLGKIKELPDFFLICEWGEDISFDDIAKEKK